MEGLADSTALLSTLAQKLGEHRAALVLRQLKNLIMRRIRQRALACSVAIESANISFRIVSVYFLESDEIAKAMAPTMTMPTSSSAIMPYPARHPQVEDH